MKSMRQTMARVVLLVLALMMLCTVPAFAEGVATVAEEPVAVAEGTTEAATDTDPAPEAGTTAADAPASTEPAAPVTDAPVSTEPAAPATDAPASTEPAAPATDAAAGDATGETVGAATSTESTTTTGGVDAATETVTTPAEDATEEAVEAESEAEAEPEEEEEAPSIFYQTYWALLPPLIAIILALITKEVYSSLFIGILSGAALYAITDAGFSGGRLIDGVLTKGVIASLADSYNAGILVFLVVLGIIVVLMNRAGGSRAYGDWAARKIAGRKGAGFATFILGCLIFVDDYFNCLTVGSVMRPVTDKQRISRVKLAYLIDATAAPICIIAPISSWAAAVSGTVENVNGIDLFIKTIPFNLYAILTLVMVAFICLTGLDFGPMKKFERNAIEKGDLFTTGESEYKTDSALAENSKGKVIDLVLPVVILIIFCVFGMLYTGGILQGESLINAFANCDASAGLALGSLVALVIVVIYMICRGVLNFNDCMSSIPEGFKAMVPAILILTFAWSLKNVTGLLGADVYVADLVESVKALQILLPAILFLVAVGLSFATGTSWGTFGILIPIVTGVFNPTAGNLQTMFIICVSACLAGAVCGDHCSPISDTTIMSSTGAQCKHVDHVSTQLPYAILVAGISLIGYLAAGFVPMTSFWAYLIPVGCVILLLAVLFGIKFLQGGASTDKGNKPLNK